MNRPKREVMTSVPNRRFQNIGYGFIPVAAQQWDLRISAIQGVMNMLETGQMPDANDEESIKKLKIVKGMFLAIVVGDQWDWFTTSRMLGFPSSDLSRQMSLRFHRMIDAIGVGSDSYFEKCVDYLKKNFAREMLGSYLDVACDSQHPVEEEGWAYILWSSSRPDELFIGANGGQIDEVTRQLRIDHPDSDPYGVMGAWLVHDPVAAFHDLRQKLGGAALGCGFYRMALGRAKEAVTQVLAHTDNYALSPWHVEDVECDNTNERTVEEPRHEPEDQPMVFGM